MFVGRNSFVRPLLAVAIAGGFALAAFTALAERASADRAATTQIFAQLQPEAGAVASSYARPLAEARNALARADNAAAAGDIAGARLLEGLAREWAELAVDVSRAQQAASDAGALQTAAADAAQRVQRARAMLDELAVRKARAAGELKQVLEAADAAPTPATPKAAGAAPKPAKPATKKGPAR
jgi:hypothetical protein